MAKVPGTNRKRAPKHGKEAAAAVAAGAAVVGGKLAWHKFASAPGEERAYRLHNAEAVPDGIRRIARGQLDSATEELAGTSDRKLGETVHETRKRLKRLRACVRLARGGLGDETYRTENSTFREAGRLLSGARDSRVLLETLDALTERFREELPPEVTARLRSQLADDHDQAIASLKGDRAVIETVVERLESARKRTAAWSFEADGFDAVAPGLERVYRRGRRAMRETAREASTENLHEWRKRVKDLWHVAQILRPGRPKRMKQLARSAHHLSDLLGDDHDLALLREYVETHKGSFEHDASRTALLAVIDRRRRALQQEALELGRRLYRRPAKRFARKVERDWQKRAPAQPQRVAT